MLQELDQDNLAEVVSSNDTVVVQYMAGWCGNCRLMKPKFKKLSLLPPANEPQSQQTIATGVDLVVVNFRFSLYHEMIHFLISS